MKHKWITKTKCDSVNQTRLPVRGSPTRLSTSGQQSYKGWSCRGPCNKCFQTVHHVTFPCSRSNDKTRSLSKSNLIFPRRLGPQNRLQNCERKRHLEKILIQQKSSGNNCCPSNTPPNSPTCTATHFYGVMELSRLQLKCDDTRRSTGGEVKGKLANGVGSQYSSHYLGTWCIRHYYHWCAHLGCQ